MAHIKPELDEKPPKRQKTSSTPDDMDPRSNPYLSHMYEDPQSKNAYSNGYNEGKNKQNKVSSGTSLGRLPRHATTSAMARKAEDGPNNPYNGQPLSKQYFDILKTRRNLPVHAQR